MNRIIKIWTGLIITITILLLILPVGIRAEESINGEKELISPENSSNLEENVASLDNSGDTQVIDTLEEVPTLSENNNLDQQIVVIYADSSETNVKNLSLTTNEVVSGEHVSDRVDIIEVNDTTNVDEVITELGNNPNVLAVGRNGKIDVTELPDDPYIVNGSAWQFEKIGADKTWDQVANSETVVVAVIDTGLNVNHPDLVGRAVSGKDYVTGNDEIVDVAGHGTEVSGCIASVANNGIGTAGVAGLSNIKIAPYRTGGEFSGDTYLDVAYICAAIMDAANRTEVKVINMSFGSYKPYPSLEAAVKYADNAGKILVASSGNEGNSSVDAGKYAYPASYDGVLSVAATTSADDHADFSQYNDKIDLCAPGVDVVTTNRNGSYETVSGTSFSSPIVAGSCAVLLAADSSLSAEAVENTLKETALDLGAAGIDNYFGSGRIQLDAAVESVVPRADISSSYRTQIENVGWQNWKSNGIPSGTTGKSLRLEGIEINVDNGGYDVGVTYQSHVQDIGWQGWKSDGETSGTTGQSLRLEAIQIKLTGADADKYDIYYRVHAENYGWLDWANNGEKAGTEGLSLRLEAIKIVIVPKGSAAPGSTDRPFVTGKIFCTYRTHVQNIGWQSWKSKGALSGTTGQSLGLEGIEINVDNGGYDVGVDYQTHVQNIGWQGWKSDGAISGTSGQSLRLEAIQIKLTGTDADKCDVYYQVHAENYGWLGWAKNGESAGTQGKSLRLEAIKIVVVPKGSAAPGSTSQPFIS